MRPSSVLATLTGRDRPGVAAAFFAALAAHDVDVRDVELVVIRDRLILTVLFDLRGDTGALRNSATTTARALGMECEVAVADDGDATDSGGGWNRSPEPRSHVMVLGHPLRPGALSHIAQRIADTGGNIESAAQISNAPMSSVEMTVGGPGQHELRMALVQAAEDTGVDIAVEPAALRRRPKRLVLIDLDATLIREQALDLLAARAGRIPQALALAARSRSEDSDAGQHLRDRLALLAGLTGAEVSEVLAVLQPVHGAREFVDALRRLGYLVGGVSVGPVEWVDRMVSRLGLDFAAGNDLEIEDGRVSGRLLGDVVDREGKARVLMHFAHKFAVPVDQTVAVGAGADDIDMIVTAGLGIAFNAKAALRVAADASLEVPYLDTVLFVLGIPRTEFGAGSPITGFQ